MTVTWGGVLEDGYTVFLVADRRDNECDQSSN